MLRQEYIDKRRKVIGLGIGIVISVIIYANFTFPYMKNWQVVQYNDFEQWVPVPMIITESNITRGDDYYNISLLCKYNAQYCYVHDNISTETDIFKYSPSSLLDGWYSKDDRAHCTLHVVDHTNDFSWTALFYSICMVIGLIMIFYFIKDLFLLCTMNKEEIYLPTTGNGGHYNSLDDL